MKKLKIFINEAEIKRQLDLNIHYITESNRTIDGLSSALGITLTHEDVSALCVSPKTFLSKIAASIRDKAQALDTTLFDRADVEAKAIQKAEREINKAHGRLSERPYGLAEICYKVENGRFILDPNADGILSEKYTIYVENEDEHAIWTLAKELEDGISRLERLISEYTGAHVLDATAVSNFTDGARAALILQGSRVSVNPYSIPRYRALRERYAKQAGENQTPDEAQAAQ